MRHFNLRIYIESLSSYKGAFPNAQLWEQMYAQVSSALLLVKK